MLDYKTTMREGGRIIIPVLFRKELHVDVGDELLLRIEDGELRIMTLDFAVKRAQKLVRKYNPEKKSLVDELLAMRKEEESHD